MFIISSRNDKHAATGKSEIWEIPSMDTAAALLAIYSQTVVRQFPYVRRSYDIQPHLCYSRNMAQITGINMSVNLRHTCLCRTTVIAGDFI